MKQGKGGTKAPLLAPLTSQLPTWPGDFSGWVRSHSSRGFTKQKEEEDSQHTFSSQAPGDWDTRKLSTNPHHVPCTVPLGLSSPQQVLSYLCQEQVPSLLPYLSLSQFWAIWVQHLSLKVIRFPPVSLNVPFLFSSVSRVLVPLVVYWAGVSQQ